MSEDVSEDGFRRGIKGPFGVVPEEKCNHSEDSNYRPVSDDIKVDVEILCKGTVDPEANIESRLALRCRKVKTNSKRLVLERGKGEDHSGSDEHVCFVNSFESAEDASKDGHRRSIKGLSAVVPEETCSLLVGSECRSVSDVVRAELDLERGKGAVQIGSGDHNCSVDSTESYESVSCSKNVNLLRLGSEDDKVPVSRDNDLYIRNGGSSGMPPDGCIHLPRPRVDVPSGDNTKDGSSAGGGPDVHTSYIGKLSAQSRILLKYIGASERDSSLASGSDTPKQALSNAMADSDHYSKHNSGDSIGGRGEGNKIKKVVLNSDAFTKGKGRQNVKVHVGKSLKGISPYVSSDGRGFSYSGSISTCYGEQ